MQGAFQLQGERIVAATPIVAQLLNKPLATIIGQPITDVFGTSNAIQLTSVLAAAKMGEQLNSTILLKPTNLFQYLELQLSTMQTEQGDKKLLGILTCNNGDTTELRQIQLLKHRYQALFEDTKDPIIYYDYEKEVITGANKKAIQLLEYENEEDMKGISRLQFIPKESRFAPGIDLHEYTKDHRLKVKNGIQFSTKGIFVSKAGKEILLNAKVVPIFAENGEGAIIFQDITKKVVDRHAKNIAETRYENIFNNSHEAIVYVNPKGHIPTVCNMNALLLFGITTIEELQMLRPIDFFIEQEVNGVPMHKFWAAFTEEALTKGRAENSFWFKKRSGEVIRVSSVFVKDKSQSAHPMLILFLRDTTDLYQAELELKNKNIELKKYIASNLQLENFAYFASHDLQAPLNTILSFSKLLQKSLADNKRAEIQEFLRFITSASQGMKVLIDDLLAYSLVNTTALNVAPTNLQKQLEKLCFNLRALIEEREAIIQFENIPDAISLDKTKIKQVFQNLITNAIKFVQPDKRPIVLITGTDKEKYWEFSVKDNGIGIKPEFQERVFGLFKRLHSTKEYKGTGIGLAIVKKVVEQHGGEISLQSKEGEGTTFWFSIAKSFMVEHQVPKMDIPKVLA